MKSIPELRQEIDIIHQELFKLLRRRRDLTLQIWQIKQQKGEAFFSASRENEILQKFLALQTEEPKDPAFEDLLNSFMKHLLRDYETYLRTKFK